MVWLGVCRTPKAKGCSKTITITSGWSKIILQQKINGVARKLKSRCLLLTRPSDFPLPDKLIYIYDLHLHESPHPNIYPVLLCLVSILRSCAEWVSSWLYWGGGINCGGA